MADPIGEWIEGNAERLSLLSTRTITWFSWGANKLPVYPVLPHPQMRQKLIEKRTTKRHAPSGKAIAEPKSASEMFFRPACSKTQHREGE